LSVDRVPYDSESGEGYDEVLHAGPLDATQAYMIIGEVWRIIKLDAFGLMKCINPQANSFYQRFRNDDPGSKIDKSQDNLAQSYPLNGFPFSDGMIRYSRFARGQLLIQANSHVKCVQKAIFLQGGFSQALNPAGTNLMSLPFPNGPTQSLPSGSAGGQYFNCDISQTTIDAFLIQDEDGNDIDYNAKYCARDSRGPDCYKPELPFCVD